MVNEDMQRRKSARQPVLPSTHLQSLPAVPPYARSPLSPREIEVLERLPVGVTVVAREMGITVTGVRSHLKNIRRKLNIPSKAVLDLLACQILAATGAAQKRMVLPCPHCHVPIAFSLDRAHCAAGCAPDRDPCPRCARRHSPGSPGT